MADDIAYLSAEDLRQGFAKGDLSPVSVLDSTLARATALEPVLNAFVLLDDNGARLQAEESEDRWRRGQPLSPLDGVPASIKDIVAMTGFPTLAGSLTSDPKQISETDCPSVARLREAGAVLFGKTHTPEFGWKGMTDSPLHGRTLNPWNPDNTPGGSSGGAGAALAAGIGPLAHGTDAGGSIRIPASYCGLFGIKPTFSRVPHSPNESPYATLASNGPLTRTVADAARMLTLLTQPDPRDWYAAPFQGIDYEAGLEDGIAGLRIALSTDLGGTRCDPEIAGMVTTAAKRFEELGATIEEVGPVFDPLRPTFEDYWKAGFAYLLKGIPEDRHELMDPGLRQLGEEGMNVGLDAYYAAVTARARLGSRMEQFHEQHELLITPTMPTTAPRADVVYHTPEFDRWAHAVPYTVPFNLTGQPAASIPLGLAKSGLPVGMQIVGPRFSERTILRACRAFERIAPFVERAPVRMG